MATPNKKQISPKGNTHGPRLLDEFVSLVPGLYYAANRLLEDSTGTLFSKKVAVALWAISGSRRRDDAGKYLTNSDLVLTFREWFVVNEKGASSVVSKVKRDMFDLGYIMIAGGSDHIHLTEKGESAASEMMARARRTVEDTLGALQYEEQASLLDWAHRMIGRARKKGQTTELFS